MPQRQFADDEATAVQEWAVGKNRNDYNAVVVNLLAALNRNLDKGIEEKVGLAGANTGNLIFVEAMKEQLDYVKEIWINPAALKDVDNPSVVIPSANFMIQGGDSLMAALIRFLENTECPVTMAGLGAQAKLDETPEELVRKLSPTQTKALKMLSERAVTIGVRGGYTAECLSILGIKNVRIIGCPSFYYDFHKRPPKHKKPSLDRMQITVTPANPLETKILEMGERHNAFWLMQMMTEHPDLALERDAWEDAWEELLTGSFPESGLSQADIWKYMKRSARIFFTKMDWDTFYEKEDITFAFGSRFHGNMAAFRKGVPTLWIVHDARTKELTEALHLPHIDYAVWEKIEAPEELLGYCDYREYRGKYRQMQRQYTAFLEENHLSHKLPSTNVLYRMKEHLTGKRM